MNLKVSTVLLFFLSFISPYKILGIFPFGSPSHYFLGNELIKGLAEVGHEATILTVFQEKHPPNENYKQIVLDGLLDVQKAFINGVTNVSEHWGQNFFFNPIRLVSNANQIFNTVTEMTLNHTKTQKLIEAKPKFDVVIVTQFSLEALKALAPHFDAHLVLFNNHGASSWMNHFVGNPSLPSLNAEIILGYTGQMTFLQRLVNTLFSIVQYDTFNGLLYPHHTELVQKYISKELDLNKIMYNVSLVLSNSHTSLTKAAASVPCMKEIAGFHVRPPRKLPDDLQQYLDDSTNGVIYFSMGSNLNSADLPVKIKIAFMTAFSKRDENILWKFEDEDIPEKAANVKVEKWLPQSDLLAHPNIKLFITHGGFLSMIETVYHAVPTITIPVFGDQQNNAKQAETDGYSKVLDLSTLTEEILSCAIEEVICNTKYRENAKIRSKIFHDRQLQPMDEAVYWIEYIVRHNGANHLKVGYIDLAWYQYYLLDVFTLIFGVIFLILFVIKKTVSFSLRKLCICNSSKLKTA